VPDAPWQNYGGSYTITSATITGSIYAGSLTTYAPAQWTTMGTATANTVTFNTITGTIADAYRQSDPGGGWVTVGYPDEQDDERRAAAEAREQEWRERNRRHRENVRAAAARARALLLEHLDAQQAAEYERHHRFDVIGSAGTRFTIGPGRAGNITVFDDAGRSIARICAHPAGDLPEPDVHLAQMIALEVDERAFVGRANCHSGTPVRYGPDGRLAPPRHDLSAGQTFVAA
jgi:hypothetical protein